MAKSLIYAHPIPVLRGELHGTCGRPVPKGEVYHERPLRRSALDTRRQGALIHLRRTINAPFALRFRRDIDRVGRIRHHGLTCLGLDARGVMFEVRTLDTEPHRGGGQVMKECSRVCRTGRSQRTRSRWRWRTARVARRQVYRGEIKNQRKSLHRLIRSLSPHGEVLSFCYEAGSVRVRGVSGDHRHGAPVRGGGAESDSTSQRRAGEEDGPARRR